jgi:ArsR family transcriptional regulator
MQGTSPVKSTNIVMAFKALSDPLRLQVLELLREREMCVCDLTEQLQVSQSKLSFHLKALREAGLIRSRRQERWIYYSLNLPPLVEVEQYLADIRRFSPMHPARICPPPP